jgi:UrcA family protein
MFSKTLRAARDAAFVTLVTTGALGAATAVHAAQTNPEPAHVAIDYADLDLATSAGVDTLYHRIVQAARRVCPQSGPTSLATKSRIRECRAAAVAEAVARINDPRLAAVHAEQQRRG